jgi:hypothetical protein
MRMKEGHMRNGQLKPACNAQTGTGNGFAAVYGLFPNPAGAKALKGQSGTPGKAGGLNCEPLKAVCFGTA